MNHTDSTNTLFHLAADLVNNTSRPIFLTGKAGTGKTTFLKYIKEQTQKNTIVVAPTGVAAINAGGVTMHSFFQLPFSPFIPGQQRGFTNNNVADKNSLFRTIHFTSAKRQLLQELELLIIDEVSMVRADMLDAMDTILRHFRKNQLVPFGGIQVVYIGDLFQLSPVMPQNEWSILKEYYESPFFFHAKVIGDCPPIYIELKKIYRQNEEHFIDILNRIRNNKPLLQDINELNSRYDPSFQPIDDDHYITLTTHNRKADVINTASLNRLPGKTHEFKAELTGEFSDKSLPTDMNLLLKEGAQIMFIKNDSGPGRKFYNGKLATVKKIKSEEILIAFTDGTQDLILEKEIWKNIKYNYNREKDEIEEEELGSFKQYPIRLAWAITIHKSQGLTFDKAIIDAGSAFAPGQVYVALSRCTSLKNLVLHSKIYTSSIATDPRVVEYAQKEANDEFLEVLLQAEKEKFQGEQLLKAFSWTKIIQSLQDWTSVIPMKNLPSKELIFSLNKDLLIKSRTYEQTAEKFAIQLKQLIQLKDDDQLQQRTNKAILYFGQAITKEFIQPVQEHIQSVKYVSRLKKYKKELDILEAVLIQYIEKINHIQFGNLIFVQFAFVKPEPKIQAVTTQKKNIKPQKGASQRDTLVLFTQGKSIEEIARLRNLSYGTIEGHLANFVYTGELEIGQLISSEKKALILEAIETFGISSAVSLKQNLNEEITYGEIRVVMNYYIRLQELNTSSV